MLLDIFAEETDIGEIQFEGNLFHRKVFLFLAFPLSDILTKKKAFWTILCRSNAFIFAQLYQKTKEQ